MARTQRSILSEIKMLIRSVDTEAGCAVLRRAVGDQYQRIQQRDSARRCKRGPGRPRLALDNDQKFKLMKYMKDGRSVRWIAKRLEIPASTLARYVAHHGLAEDVARVRSIGGLGEVTGGRWQRVKRGKAWRRLLSAHGIPRPETAADRRRDPHKSGRGTVIALNPRQDG